jgi:outer membrane protein TolC
MIPKYAKIITVLAVIVLLGGISSAKELTLEDCIDMALRNHNSIISARGTLNNAKQTVWTTAGAFLPSFSVSGNVSETHRPSSVESVIGTYGVDLGDGSFLLDTTEVYNSGFSKGYSFGISSSLTWFNGGRNIFNYLGSKTEKAYWEYQLEQARQNIILEVKQKYFAYLKAQDSKRIYEEAVKRGEEQYKLASSRYEVGSASKSDMLKAQVQYGQDKLQLLRSENQVRLAHAQMAYLIGIDVNSDVEFSKTYQRKRYDDTEETALKYGLSYHPGLLASHKNIEASKYDLKSTWGRFLPTITTSFDKSWSASTWDRINDLSYQDQSWRISTSINWSIFANFDRKRDLSRARAALNTARADYAYAKNSVTLAVKQAWLDIKLARESLSVAEENVAAASEDMALVQEKYRLGAATILDVLKAQESLITAQNSKVEADFDYNLSVAELENAMGVR